MVNRLLAERISHERELRVAEKTAFDHERELRTLWDTHERELRLQAETAVEKARDTQFREYERRLESMNQFREQLTDQARSFLTIERYERDHKALSDRVEAQYEVMQARLSTEERVTARQDSAALAVEGIRSNNRWLIGIALGLVTTIVLFGLHLMGIY
jgi:hypothetical protein